MHFHSVYIEWFQCNAVLFSIPNAINSNLALLIALKYKYLEMRPILFFSISPRNLCIKQQEKQLTATEAVSRKCGLTT